MEVVGLSSVENNMWVSSVLESMVVETVLAAGKSLACLIMVTGSLLNDISVSPKLTAMDGRVPNPKSVSSTSNFKPFHSYTSLTFPNPPNPTNPSAPNSSFALLKTLDSAALERIFSGSATQSLPIDGSNGSSSSSTRLTPSTMTALALRVTTQRGSVSENRRRRVAGRDESSPEEPSKKWFSWRWVATWNGERSVVTWRWATASGSRSLTSTSIIIGRRGRCGFGRKRGLCCCGDRGGGGERWRWCRWRWRCVCGLVRVRLCLRS
ncbi:hypothetical protein CFP56_021427 [Quercus suber]|uniref:Uncharacterized protein n=1 Tax=Quercus suber TaxID=58331 RepID=A0AAW0KD43_QUESU